MATLLPPPKRQKIENGIPVSEPVKTENTCNVIVQFVSEDDGVSFGPAVSLPADVSTEGLQTLVNNLKSQVTFVIIIIPF